MTCSIKSIVINYVRQKFKDDLYPEAIIGTGEVNLEEAKFLSQLVNGITNSGPIIEIGTLFGWSTKIIILNKPYNNKVITVDHYGWNPFNLSSSTHRRITQEILAEARTKFNVKQLAIDKNEFYQTYQGNPPALVFLDAYHSYDETKKDLVWAKSIKASIICGHDYCKSWPGVIQAVNEFGPPKKVVGSLWVL